MQAGMATARATANVGVLPSPPKCHSKPSCVHSRSEPTICPLVALSEEYFLQVWTVAQ